MKITSMMSSQLNLIEKLSQMEGTTLEAELDKLIPAEPKKIGVDYFQGYTLDQYACPNCDRPIGDEMLLFPHCPACGQRIGKL